MPQRLRYAELAPQGIAVLRQLEHYLNTGTTLSPVLLELLRLRVSTLNGCDFCIKMHTAELMKHNEPQSRIDAIADWRSSDAFTPRERAALAYADSVTNIQQTHVSDEEYAAINEFFTGKDLADLTLAIASINNWNRLAIPFRSEWDPGPAKPEASNEPAAVNLGDATVSAVGDDGGKVAED
ncbi:MAG TPA: carboxymuconolactone decarboxylase family protein [Acidobacteriaceae bacterium]|nr:carboxymuconolactone decarboxylase family protein [Acidobacteriaceae bacterium]